MRDPFGKFGGVSAILVGVLSILFAAFWALERRPVPMAPYGKWLTFALSGLFSSAAYVALYERVKSSSPGYALWGLVLGVAASFAILIHGGFETLLFHKTVQAEGGRRAIFTAAKLVPSQVDPTGLATFFVVGIVSFVFSWLILQSGTLPGVFGRLGIANGVLLWTVFVASAADIRWLVLASGGLTLIVVGPIWWIWLGSLLMKE